MSRSWVLVWTLEISLMALQISLMLGRGSMLANRMTSGLSFLIDSMKLSIVFFSMFRISRPESASRAFRIPERMMSEGQKIRMLIFFASGGWVFFFSMLFGNPFIHCRLLKKFYVIRSGGCQAMMGRRFVEARERAD